MNLVSMLGFLGSCISGGAYVPQIYHLIHERCTAGLSQRAFSLWMVSSVLLLINAISIASPVFIFLSSIQTIATATILAFMMINKGGVCEYHQQEPAADAWTASRKLAETRRSS